MKQETLGQMIDQAAARLGAKDAFCIGDRSISYAQLRRESDDVAKGLLEAGVRKGERVALWMGNRLEWPVIFYAIAKIGAVIVPVSTKFKMEETAYILAQCEVSTLILNDRFSGIDFVEMLYGLVPELKGPGGKAPVSQRFPHLRNVICLASSDARHPGLLDYEAMVAQGRAKDGRLLADARAGVTGADPLLIQSTSGTTGFPKGAVLTQQNFVRTGFEVGVKQQLKESDRFFSPAPYFHVSGTMHAFTAPIAHGCTVYSMEKYELEKVVDTICRNECKVYHGFNFFKDYFARRGDFGNEFNLGVLDRAWTTGTLVDLANIGSLGIKVCSLYGLSETTGCSTICVPDDPEIIRTTTVGKPFDGVEICIKDRHGSGAVMAPGQEGEICIRGWNVMAGYYNKPEETRETFDEDGWFHSGDLGLADAQRNVSFLGRIKDIIRVGGENLSPLEVENLLRRHPKVAEACVVGVPDARLGEVCMAFIKLKAGSRSDDAEILSFCRNQIAGYKIPRHVRFVDEFPLTGSNKIRRVEVKEIALKAVA